MYSEFEMIRKVYMNFSLFESARLKQWGSKD